MLKIVVTGAFSTGKTTLVGDLQLALEARGVNVVVVPDVARESRLPLNERQTEDASLWLLTTQIAREIEAKNGKEGVILCDRGVPDILAHHGQVAEQIDGPRILLMYPFLRDWMASYDVMLFSRVDESQPIVADGLRVLSPNYRTKLDAFAHSVLRGMAAVRMLPNDGDLRVTYALDAIFDKLPRIN